MRKLGETEEILIMKVLITGADGFIGKNLRQHLSEHRKYEVICFTRKDRFSDLKNKLKGVEFIFHLAGINRPKDQSEFKSGNFELTKSIITLLESEGNKAPILFSSSVQAELNNDYGHSKRMAEEALVAYGKKSDVPIRICRLPNVFGKWSKPNYNSVVATFCHNIANDKKITINDPNSNIRLTYIDDVIDQFMSILDSSLKKTCFFSIEPTYEITVGRLAEQINKFKETQNTLMVECVGTGLLRALYSTFISYLPPKSFSHFVAKHSDERGDFVEMLKTKSSGQMSYFTAFPGVTRGGHYHHTKTEKFLVIKGRARFRFRHVLTGEKYELETSSQQQEIVETIPGWAHDITNIGSEELIVMLWANEVFDKANPDTFYSLLD